MATAKENSNTVKTEELNQKPSVALIGLLMLEIIIGYEWLVSGLTKVVLGDFPSGLAGELADKAADVAAWYAPFLNGFAIPNAVAFGYVIEIAEVLVGLALVAGPLIWLFAWERIPSGFQSTVVLLMAAASIGAILMALNFHLANGNSHPWLLPKDSFDEGVDFDSLLAILNIVTATVNIWFFRRLREAKTDTLAVPAPLRQPKLSGTR
jgi:thiosulfate dehydrogenase [quinone] large subunit